MTQVRKNPCMPLRIHFTGDDLARTRVTPAPWPLWELSIAVRELQARDNPVRLGAWRRQVLPGLPPQVRGLFQVMPQRGVIPDILSPPVGGNVNVLLDQVRSTPAGELRRQFEALPAAQASAATRLLLSDRKAPVRLAGLLGEVYERALLPYWTDITRIADADRAARSKDLLHGGVERLLSGLFPPRIRWRPPVLEIDMMSGTDADVRLHGRGLLLAPSPFLVTASIIDVDAAPQPVLAYPAHHDPARLLGATAVNGGRTSLVKLLGRTRAAVLHTIAERPGCTTTELASTAGISPASASEHAGVLRGAGLITARRHRNTMLHVISPIGMALLNA
jgi:DNA-binding transcriptional ArsR family regulator